MSEAPVVTDAPPDEDPLDENTANDAANSSIHQSFLIGTLIPTIALGIIPFFLFFVAFINKLHRRITRAVGPDLIEESFGTSTSVLPLDSQVGTSRTVMVSADEVAEAPEPYYVEPEPEITTEDKKNGCKNNVINIDLDSTTQDRHIKFTFQFNDPCVPCTSGANKDGEGSDPKSFQGSFKYPQDGKNDGGQANVFFRGYISKTTDPNFKPLPPPPQRTEGPTTSKAKSFPEPFQLQTSVSSPAVHNSTERTPIKTNADTGPEKITNIQKDLRPVVYKTGEVEDLSTPPPPAQCIPEKTTPNMAPGDVQNLGTVVYKTDATVEEPPPANYRVDGESQPLETPRRTDPVAKPQGRSAQLPSKNNIASTTRPPPVQSAKSPQINDKAKQSPSSTHPEPISNKDPSFLTPSAVNKPATTLSNDKVAKEKAPNAPEKEVGRAQDTFNAANAPNLRAGTPQVVEPVQQKSANVEKIKPSENLEIVTATKKRPVENPAEVLQKIAYKTIKTPEPLQTSSVEYPMKYTTSAPVVAQRSQPTEATKDQKQESPTKDPRPIAYATRQTPETLEPQIPANSEKPMPQTMQATANPNELPASNPEKVALQANKNDVTGHVKGTAEEKKPLIANKNAGPLQPFTQHNSSNYPGSSKKAVQETKNVPVEKTIPPLSLVRGKDIEADGPADHNGPLWQPAAKPEQRLPILVDPQRPAEATIVHQPIIIDPQHPVDYATENPEVSIKTQQKKQASSSELAQSPNLLKAPESLGRSLPIGGQSDVKGTKSPQATTLNSKTQPISRNEGKPGPSKKILDISEPQEAVEGGIHIEKPNEERGSIGESATRSLKMDNVALQRHLTAETFKGEAKTTREPQPGRGGLNNLTSTSLMPGSPKLESQATPNGAESSFLRAHEVPKSKDQRPSENVEVTTDTAHPSVTNKPHLMPVAPQVRSVVPTLQSATTTDETVLHPSVQSIQPESVSYVPTSRGNLLKTTTRESRTNATQVVPSDVVANKLSAREASTDARTEVTTMTESWPVSAQDNSPVSTEQSLPPSPIPTSVAAQSSGSSQTERQQSIAKFTPAVFANVAPTGPRAVTSDRHGTGAARSIQPIDHTSVPTLATNLRTHAAVHEQVEVNARVAKVMDESQSQKFGSSQRSSPPRQIEVAKQSNTNEPLLASTHMIATPPPLLTDSVLTRPQVQFPAVQGNQEMKPTLEYLASARLIAHHEPVSPTAKHDPVSPTAKHDPVSPTTQHDTFRPIVPHDPVSPIAQHGPASPTTQHGPVRPTAQPDPVKPTSKYEAVRPAAPLYSNVSAQKDPVSQVRPHEPRSAYEFQSLVPVKQQPTIANNELPVLQTQANVSPSASPEFLVSRHQVESPMLNAPIEMSDYSSPSPALTRPVSYNQPELPTRPLVPVFSSHLPQIPVVAKNIPTVAPPTKESTPFDSVGSPQTHYVPRQQLSMPSSDRTFNPAPIAAPHVGFNASTISVQGPSRHQIPELVSAQGNIFSQPAAVSQLHTNPTNLVFGNNPLHMQASSSRTLPAPVNVITPGLSQHPQVPPKVAPVQHLQQHRAHSQQLWLPSIPTEANRMPKFASSTRHQVEKPVEDTSILAGPSKGSIENEKWIKEHRCARRLRHKSKPPSTRWCKKVEDGQIPPCPPRVPIKAGRLCPVVTCGPRCTTTAPTTPPPAAVQSLRHVKVHGTPSKTKRDSMTLPNMSTLLTRLGCPYCNPDRIIGAAPFCPFHSDLHTRPCSRGIYHRPSLCRLSSSRCTFESSSVLPQYQDSYSPLGHMIPCRSAIFYQPYLMQQYQVMDFYRGPLSVYNAVALQFTPFCTTARRRAVSSFSYCNSPTDSESESPPHRMPSIQSEVLYPENVEQEPFKFSEDLPMVIQVQPQQQRSSPFVPRVPFQAQVPMELDVAGPSRSRSRPIARSMPPKVQREVYGATSGPAVPQNVNFSTVERNGVPPLRVASVQPIYEDIVPCPILRPAAPQEYPLFSKAIATSMQEQEESTNSGLYYEPPSKRRSIHREQTIGTSTVGRPDQLFPLNFIRNDPVGSEARDVVAGASGSREILPPTAVESEVLLAVPKAADSMLMLLQNDINQERIPHRIQVQDSSRSPATYQQVEPYTFHNANCERYQPANFPDMTGGAQKKLKNTVCDQEELMDKTSGILASLSIDKAMLQLLVGKVEGSHECSQQPPCRTQSLNLDKKCCASSTKAKEAEDVDMYTKKVRRK